MSQLNRLSKTLLRATQAWADVEAEGGAAYEMRDVQFASSPSPTAIAEQSGLATFRVRAHEPWTGRTPREYIVTITESEVSDA